VALGVGDGVVCGHASVRLIEPEFVVVKWSLQVPRTVREALAVP
jgi:hypothetical protein